MSFSNLNKDKKIQILNISKKSNEDMLYESLIRLGIDPVVFDLENFDSSDLPSDTMHKEFVNNLKKSVSLLKLINSELSLLEQ
jgi:hypothetical protein